MTNLAGSSNGEADTAAVSLGRRTLCSCAEGICRGSSSVDSIIETTSSAYVGDSASSSIRDE